VILLLGGSAALLSHGAKAGTRAIFNAGPEPFSNVVLSTLEDLATAGLIWLVLAHPATAVTIALLLLALAIAIVVAVRRLWKRTRSRQGP
jgi:hypothetical protein